MKTIIPFIVLSMLLTTAGLSAQQNENVFTYKVGDYEVSLLSEGQGNGNTGILIGATPEMLQKAIPQGSFPNAVNTFLLRTAGKNILIDTGHGRKLWDNLQYLGVSPEQIDVVLLTHMHGDHIGGMMKDGKVAFANADVYLPKPEHDYWTSDEAMNKQPEGRRGGFTNARAMIDAYKNKLHLFDPVEIENAASASASEIIPAIKGIAAYGHTPGHTMFELQSNGQKLLIWGDLTHAMAIQMPYPQVAVTYDVNPEDAIRYRTKILKHVSANKVPVAGMHIAYPGMGTVSPQGEGYLFTPLK